ncbi:MAG TPA: endonuclease III [bacterium]|nr:endonuclease III [bacterium]HOL47466.1 endonuclease III [bacterium]HPQ18946.1 endonuclease III [bacterium]
MEKEKVKKIIAELKKEYGNLRTALKYNTEFEILVATILSAQCTDERVNKVTEKLFKKYRTINDYANANIKEFEQEIKSTGFYRNKAKNIINSAKKIIEKFNGKVPDNMNDLLQLPGVARKTANVVLNNAFNKAEGIVVDTHVRRLANRIGLSKNNNAEKIEEDLMKIINKNDWIIFSYLLIEHGRQICKARKPDCTNCKINNYCEKNGLK